MDEEKFTEEQKSVILRLSATLMKNEAAEADAVKGYTEQLEVIRIAKEQFDPASEYWQHLDKLEAATEEKIQDELNHGHSLYEEFTTLTGIAPAED